MVQSAYTAYVLDSYAVIAFFEGKWGCEQIKKLLEQAVRGECKLIMIIVNLGEVLYIVERERGLPCAQETLARVDELPIIIVDADRQVTTGFQIPFCCHLRDGQSF